MPDIDKTAVRLKYNIPQNACVFIFSGNLGIGHGLRFLVETIKTLEDYERAFFIIGGSGTQFHFLMESFKAYSHRNVLLYEWLPREDFNDILKASDIGLILLHKYSVPQFPSRLLSYLDYSKPVLCAVNNYTDIGTIVEENGCGRAITHGNLDEFISIIRFFSENEEERKRMGESGRSLLVDNYTTSHSYKIIMSHFENSGV
jgi:glycosyltransferase involved in cell wall biosynthesis